MRFMHPEPAWHNPQIYPVFIPFAGCKTRCVFCSQNIQTGQELESSHDIIARVEEHFAAADYKKPMDLAYYGGTFTALPENEQADFLALAARLKNKGMVRQVRCSTRPDAVTPNQLKKLREWGLDCMELGIQSFCSAPLTASLRDYSGASAYKACQMVQETGMSLGVQLMPGMPGQNERHFAEDIKICLELKPDAVRLYPCLVIDGTALATRWERGHYQPWTLEETLERLSPAVLALWEQGIRTIRLGLAPEESLLENILAGPFHPALGQCLRSRALYIFLKKHLITPKGEKLAWGKRLLAPRRVQGEFFGHKGDLKAAYEELGLTASNVEWHCDEYFEIFDPKTA
jgi:histone acetyltransferase (RNA polymerase elongator complex component)